MSSPLTVEQLCKIQLLNEMYSKTKSFIDLEDHKIEFVAKKIETHRDNISKLIIGMKNNLQDGLFTFKDSKSFKLDLLILFNSKSVSSRQIFNDVKEVTSLNYNNVLVEIEIFRMTLELFKIENQFAANDSDVLVEIEKFKEKQKEFDKLGEMLTEKVMEAFLCERFVTKSMVNLILRSYATEILSLIKKDVVEDFVRILLCDLIALDYDSTIAKDIETQSDVIGLLAESIGKGHVLRLKLFGLLTSKKEKEELTKKLVKVYKETDVWIAFDLIENPKKNFRPLAQHLFKFDRLLHEIDIGSPENKRNISCMDCEYPQRKKK